MLKRLELIGFKSFADRTRFDFAPGITAIVGPNGSGKSNVVDAVKWILGEQSAKSLRGGEMADVIFNGSNTRKSLGLAEVTMTFDNTKRQLQFDGDEVQFTRRVYRDGQGEYLINGTTARLKDIKEMFLGSGAGHGAYSIIEQGRVDALLLASTKDRRQIFEEAAGISRFKAKKTEALRKLEATELNLNRVRDILQELVHTLKTLQSQATKAKKYQEYQSRLKELRISLGHREFREITDTLTYQEEVLARLRNELQEATAKITEGETAVNDFDSKLSRTEESLRFEEKLLGETRQRIAEQDAAAKSHREQVSNFEADRLRIGAQRSALARRLRVLKDDAEKAAAEAETAARELAGEQLRADAAASALNVVTATIAEFSRQTQAARDGQFALVSRAAQLKSTADMTVAQVERLGKELLRKKAESDKAKAEADAIGRVLADLSQSNAGVQEELATAKSDLDTLQQQQVECRRSAEALQPRLDGLRDRRADLRGRADVLEQLERSLEGFGSGVKAVLEATRGKTTPIFGLVADLITVPHEYAPLIDLALGEISQRFVCEESSLGETLAAFRDLPGRVGFLPFEPGERNPSDSAYGKQHHGAVTPRSPVEFATSSLPGLVSHLLGNVLIVESIQDVFAHHKPGYRYISLAGEVFEADGSVVIGPRGGDAGILSRKSELRSLREQLASIDEVVKGLESEQATLRQSADTLETPIGGRTAQIAALVAKAGDLRDNIAGQREKQARLRDLIELTMNESAILSDDFQKAEAALAETSRAAVAAEAEAAALKATIEAAEVQLRQAESSRETRQHENTTAQVALSQAKQHESALASRRQTLDTEIRTRETEEASLAEDDRNAEKKLMVSLLAALRASATAAMAYSNKDQQELTVAAAIADRNCYRSARECRQDDLRIIRDNWKSRQDQAHAHELTVRDLTNRRQSITDRIREDYSIDLAELNPDDFQPQPGNDEEVQSEIDELKRKLTRLGSVNLEALDQLAVEEAREKTLRTEFDDLTAAQASLLQIIETINTDSRRLFADTLAAVRIHFQELFRKLFGGGMADIVFEDPLDVLETGIEITARPPGKELRSISLLSGGEKTLTAVALLLAIFRSRPSPFCLLDEVDAALDEANTARLASVLREFLDQSQFIIITHKKRTMAMADVLYGITMQESGISKQVATRIEDWPDDEPEKHAA